MLSKADPGKAGWQRDLSVSHRKVGDVQEAQGNLVAGRAIVAKLIQTIRIGLR